VLLVLIQKRDTGLFHRAADARRLRAVVDHRVRGLLVRILCTVLPGNAAPCCVGSGSIPAARACGSQDSTTRTTRKGSTPRARRSALRNKSRPIDAGAAGSRPW
jgi:hypothetical protein